VAISGVRVVFDRQQAGSYRSGLPPRQIIRLVFGLKQAQRRLWQAVAAFKLNFSRLLWFGKNRARESPHDGFSIGTTSHARLPVPSGVGLPFRCNFA